MARALVLSFLLTAAPTPPPPTPPSTPVIEAVATPAAPLARLEDLRALAANKSWDELYLSVAAADPARFDSAVRGELARLLLTGAHADDLDRILALSLAERSLQFEESDAGLLRASDLALAIGDQPSAIRSLERAMARRPTDDRLRLRRAQIARAQRDWDKAEALYSAVAAASDSFAAAQQGLTQLKAEREQDEAMGAEAAQRDLMRRRERAEKMIEALPVTNFELCRAHTIAACEAIATCKKLTANCSLLLDSCPDSRAESGLARKELPICANTLATIECDAREMVIGRLSGNVCRGLSLRTERRLLPEDSQKTPVTDDSKGEKGQTQGEIQRLIQQVGGNGV
ncbi:MAG: hypothetical protein LBM75_10540 [Myxococcales bacterium]|jgi:hypothetical protein|nr:hypothetical protein [Myxococcales bacterium]